MSSLSEKIYDFFIEAGSNYQERLKNLKSLINGYGKYICFLKFKIQYPEYYEELTWLRNERKALKEESQNYRDAIWQAVSSLLQTKSIFKSKKIAEIREKLLEVL